MAAITTDQRPTTTARRPIKWHTLWVALIGVFWTAIVVGIIGGFFFHWNWTGFPENGKLWDWLQLLSAPVFVSALPLIFTGHRRQADDRLDPVSRVALVVGATGLIALAVGIWNERMMQRHRQPGVTYRDVTFRRDGAWRRADLFTEQGLKHQRQASSWGFSGLALIVIALVLVGLTPQP